MTASKGSPTTRLSARRSRRSAPPSGRHAVRGAPDEASPVAAGLGGGSSDAATTLELANGHLARTTLGRAASTTSRPGSAQTCPSSCRRPAARDRRRHDARAARLPRDYSASWCRGGRREVLDARRLRGLRCAGGCPRLQPRPSRAPRSGRADRVCGDLVDLRRTTSPRRPRRGAAGARRVSRRRVWRGAGRLRALRDPRRGRASRRGCREAARVWVTAPIGRQR